MANSFSSKTENRRTVKQTFAQMQYFCWSLKCEVLDFLEATKHSEKYFYCREVK